MATNESQYYQPGMYQSIENAYLARAKHKKAHKAKKAAKLKKPHVHTVTLPGQRAPRAPRHGDRVSHVDPYKKAAKHARVAHAAKGKA